jgi:hypothetical protein
MILFLVAKYVYSHGFSRGFHIRSFQRVSTCPFSISNGLELCGNPMYNSPPQIKPSQMPREKPRDFIPDRSITFLFLLSYLIRLRARLLAISLSLLISPSCVSISHLNNLLSSGEILLCDSTKRFDR